MYTSVTRKHHRRNSGFGKCVTSYDDHDDDNNNSKNNNNDNGRTLGRIGADIP
jgi:hypothetical protein